MRTFLASLLFLIFTLVLPAEIIEIKRMEEINSHIKPDTIILLDIDNTLIEPKQEMGSDQWFHYLIKKYQREGMDAHHALEKALSEWFAVQSITEVRLVEKGNDRWVQRLQSQHFPVMGLTTRLPELSIKTIEQLRSVSIDLSKSSPFKKEYAFNTTKPLLYRNGILFTSGTHKGRALFTFLQHMGHRPKRILFVNDKASHIQEVEESARIQDIPFVGLRYGYLDEKVKTFKPHIAEIQFAHFARLLSNEKAQELFKKNSPLNSKNPE